MWRTLVRPDSSGHLLLWEPVTDLMGSYRSAVESRFVEDVWVVDVRPLLFGRPEFSFVRADSAVSNLLAAFESAESKGFDGGVRVHHLWGARARAGTPGIDGETWTLELGEKDGAFIRGFVPPAHVVSIGRGVPPGAEIRIPWSGFGPVELGLEIGHAMGAGASPPYEIRIDGDKVGRVRPDGGWQCFIICLPERDFTSRGEHLSILLRPLFEEAPNARGLAVLRRVVLNPGIGWMRGSVQN